MIQQMKYGRGATLQLDLPDERLLAGCLGPRGEPLDDPSAAVTAALTHPEDYPPLVEATVPGDRIVLALDRAVPDVEAVVAGVINTLLEGRSEPEDIRIVQAQPLSGQQLADPLRLLPEDVREKIQVETHDPTSSGSLSYLAASRDAKPIYFNRAIMDADVVLPIGMVRVDRSLGYLGIHGGLFPTFSDERTQERFRAPVTGSDNVDLQRHREEADEAAWLLGIQLVLQVIPGPGDSILHVLAGTPPRVAERGRQLCEEAWNFHVPARANLVVATIEGGPQQQNWDSFARALFAASQVVQERGTIVLCTDLRCELGPSLQSVAMIHEDEQDALLRKLRRDRTPDAEVAKLLVEARQRARLYLMSGLDADLVEDLGLAHVEQPEDINRLMRQHESCILMSNAQYAVLTPPEA